MIKFNEEGRFPTGVQDFDGELDPLGATIDCTASRQQLYMAKEGWPRHWDQTWRNVEEIVTDLVTNKCALVGNLTLQVGVMTTNGAPKLTAQVKHDVGAAREYPHEKPGALSGPGWMLN